MPIESGCTLSTSLGVQGQASLEPDVTLSVALTNRSDLILVEDRHSLCTILYVGSLCRRDDRMPSGKLYNQQHTCFKPSLFNQVLCF